MDIDGRVSSEAHLWFDVDRRSALRGMPIAKCVDKHDIINGINFSLYNLLNDNSICREYKSDFIIFNFLLSFQPYY
jgi:hypothetical protein